MRKIVRFAVAWIIAPVVLLFIIPSFAFLDYLFDATGAPQSVFYNWLQWATFKGE